MFFDVDYNYCLLFSAYGGGIVASAVIGKMCIAAAFAGIYNYSAEIYPTVLRNSGTGLSSLFARIGSFCAPQIHLLVSLSQGPRVKGQGWTQAPNLAHSLEWSYSTPRWLKLSAPIPKWPAHSQVDPKWSGVAPTWNLKFYF